jgi:hypothetical protein
MRLQAFTSVVVLALWVTPAIQATAGPIVRLTDFIPDGSRTSFNGFEGIPHAFNFFAIDSFTGGSGPYTEGGISVNQVNSNLGNPISVAFFHPEGSFGWYPSGGDHGFTRITLESGGDFDAVGLLRGTGNSSDTNLMFYELREGGVTVLSGSVSNNNNGGAGLYLGFSGGGFDEILLRNGDVGAVTNGSLNGLAIDAIETSNSLSATPEPASLILLGTGIAGMAGYGWRRRKRAAP